MSALPRQHLALASLVAVVLAGGAAAFIFGGGAPGPDPIESNLRDALAAVRSAPVPEASMPSAPASQLEVPAPAPKPAPAVPTREQAGLGIVRAVLAGKPIASADAAVLREFRVCFRDRTGPEFDFTCVDLRGAEPVIETGIAALPGFDENTAFTLEREAGHPKLFSADVGKRGLALGARSLSSSGAAEDASKKRAAGAEVEALMRP